MQETTYERGAQAARETLGTAREKLGTAREKLGTAVDYFREHDARAITNDFKGYLQSHPTQALVGAVVLGFLAGRVIRRS